MHFIYLFIFWSVQCVSATLCLTVSSELCVCVLCLCALGAWYVGRANTQNGVILCWSCVEVRWKHTLSPRKPFPHWVAYPSHLGNKQVNHCGATASVHRDCSSLPCHLIFLLVMCLTKSAQLCLPTGCFSCSFFFLIRYVFNTLLVHLLGTCSILLDSVLRFSHWEKVTWRCLDPKRGPSLVFLEQWRQDLNSACSLWLKTISVWPAQFNLQVKIIASIVIRLTTQLLHSCSELFYASLFSCCLILTAFDSR